MSLVGKDRDELLQYLRETSGVSDDDQQVDHIFPVSRYKDKGHIDRCMHYSNLQLLPGAANLSKSDKLPTKAMAAKVARWAWPDGVTEEMLPDQYDGWRTPLWM